MEYIIENKQLKVVIADKGAELQSIYSKEHSIEYMWNGDPVFWGKKSPVLFPIVGGLKNNQYTYKGTSYTLGRHGFARDMVFSALEVTPASISLKLDATEESQTIYPFLFRLIIHYKLEKNSLSCTYEIRNTDIKPMPASIGAHPAFAIPITPDTSFEDYTLEFDEVETASKWPLSAAGLIETKAVPFFDQQQKIELRKDLFYGDALVFKNLQSQEIKLISPKTKHGWTFSWKNFPFMGIWSAKDANFVCIEPWCGIADSVDTIGDIMKKEGIHILIPGEIFTRTWGVRVH
jgi:galactose mutarotase-like enzyme